MRVTRFERADATLKPPQKLDNGFMRVEGRISRVGIQEYQRADGSVSRELRLPEEVFHPDSIASFAQLPVTNRHPPGMLTAKNAKKYTVGSVGENVRQDGDYVAAPLLIVDEDAIGAVERGRTQLSCGYSCELDTTQDEALTAQWGKYDAIMRNIRGNHVALVDVGRAGPGASIRLDGLDSNSACAVDLIDSTESQKMHKFAIDGLNIEVSDANAQAIIERAMAKLTERADAADKALAEAKTELEVYKAKVKEHADSAATFDSRLAAEVEKIAMLGAEVAKHGVDTTKLKPSEPAYHAAALAKLSPKLSLDGMDAAALATAYKTAASMAAEQPSAIDLARQGIVEGQRADAASDNKPATARERMIANIRAQFVK